MATAVAHVPPAVQLDVAAGFPASFAILVVRSVDADDALVLLRSEHTGTRRSALARGAQVLAAAVRRHGARGLALQVLDADGMPVFAREALR